MLYSTGNSMPGWVGLDNGAFTNQDHLKGYIGGVLAGSGLTYGVYGLGIGLSFIPFVGPIIAAPILAIAGVMGFEMSPAGGTQQHINPIYQNLDRNLLGTDFKTVGASIPADWTQTSFTSFYNAPNDGFKPSLEVVGSGDGIATVALLHTLNSTYLYLVNSSDNLIQNDETLLLARVNGFVSASDLALFDSDDPQHAPYAGGSSMAIVKPAKAVLGFEASTPGKKVVVPSEEVPTSVLTNDSSLQLEVSFDSDLVAGDRVTLRITRSTGTTEEGREVVANPVGAHQIASGATETVFALSLDSSETVSVNVIVKNTDGFTTESDIYTLSADSKAPSLTVDPSAAGVQFSSDERATLTLYAGSSAVKIDGSNENYSLYDDQTKAFAKLVPIAVQATPLWIDQYGVEDALSNAMTLSAGPDDLSNLLKPVIGLPQIGLGTTASDILNAANIGARASWNAALYGFAGDDNLSGGSGSNRFYGGEGNDSITVGVNSASNLISGDAGGDSIDLTAVHTSAVVLVAGSVGKASDSYEGQTNSADDFDTITGFTPGTDSLTIVLSGLGDFDINTDVSIVSPTPPATATVLKVDVDSDTTLGGTEDIHLEFNSGSPDKDEISFNLTALENSSGSKLSGGKADDVLVGSNGNDTLSGSEGNDILTGGKGKDSLSGGSGNDTFFFQGLDSSSDATSCDQITDFTNGDKIDLSKISIAFGLATGSATSPAGAGISFTEGFDAFTYQDTTSNTTYLVYETKATTEGPPASATGPLEMIEVVGLSGALTVFNGQFSL